MSKMSLAERVGRSFRGNPFTNLWVEGPLLGLMVLMLLSRKFIESLSEPVFLSLMAFVGLAYFTWLGFVLKWSRQSFLDRSAAQRKRAEVAQLRENIRNG